MSENCDIDNQDICQKTTGHRSLIYIGRKYLPVLALVILTVLGGYLRLFQLGSHGIGNAYYAATVKSMLGSWQNFFYAAFEPGGSISVDKPPVGFWFQVISARIFGFNGFALAFPQALAGTLSIPILFYLVRHHYGNLAGLAAASVLSVTPITIATERNNTVDGMLVFVLLLSIWAFIHSIHSGKVRFLILGSILIGVGFNIKMMQAYLIIPALFIYYFMAANSSWKERLAHLFLSTAIIIIVSFSWAIIVDMTPAVERPYVGGSNKNSVFDLAFSYNGIQRLVKLNNDSTRKEEIAMNVSTDESSTTRQDDLEQDEIGIQTPFMQQPPPSSMPAGANPPGSYNLYPPQSGFNMFQQPGSPPPQNIDTNGSPPPGGGNLADPFSPLSSTGTSGEIGEAGFQRLFTNPLADDISWLFPPAILGIFLTLFIWKKWNLDLDCIKPLILWTGWLLTGWAFFSYSTGLFHKHYLIMLGPPLAVLCGITVWAIIFLFNKKHMMGISFTLLVFSLTFAYQLSLLYSDKILMNQVVFITGTFFLVGFLLAAESILSTNEHLSKIAIMNILFSLLIAPICWSLVTIFNVNPDPRLPKTGPSIQTGPPETIQMTPQQENVLTYLTNHTGDEPYLVATLSTHEASGLILETGRPVLTFGGFSGSEDIIDLQELQEMIQTKQLRFILGGEELSNQKPEFEEWITSNCSVVNLQSEEQPDKQIEGDHPPSSNNTIENSIELYDCY